MTVATTRALGTASHAPHSTHARAHRCLMPWLTQVDGCPHAEAMKAAMVVQRAVVTVVLATPPKAKGALHALGWLASSFHALDIAHSPLFEVGTAR
jgi:hypothetical protein